MESHRTVVLQVHKSVRAPRWGLTALRVPLGAGDEVNWLGEASLISRVFQPLELLVLIADEGVKTAVPVCPDSLWFSWPRKAKLSQPPASSNGFIVHPVLSSQAQATLLLPGEWPPSKMSWPFSIFDNRPTQRWACMSTRGAALSHRQISITAGKWMCRRLSVSPGHRVPLMQEKRQRGPGGRRSESVPRDGQVCLQLLQKVRQMSLRNAKSFISFFKFIVYINTLVG